MLVKEGVLVQADELLVTLLKLSEALTNQLFGTIFDIHETKVSKISTGGLTLCLRCSNH